MLIWQGWLRFIEVFDDFKAGSNGSEFKRWRSAFLLKFRFCFSEEEKIKTFENSEADEAFVVPGFS